MIDNSPAPVYLDLVTDIDGAWIQSVLRHAGIDVQVAAIRTEPIGAGNVSDTVRVEIDYVTGSPVGPPAVVVKLRPSDRDVHAHGLRSGAYHREIGAYRDIGAREACRIPQCFWVNGDETTINLVMEDLSTTTVPGDQVAGCGPVEAEAVVTELAHLHSRFFPLTEETAPAWMIRLTDVCEYWSDAAENGARAALTRFAGDLPPDFVEAIEEGTALVRQWHNLPHKNLSFTHGDPRVDNVLFETSGDDVRAVIIDWQVTGLRNPMYDVGYFLSGSVSAEDRRAHEKHLIRRYVEVFAESASGYNEAVATADYQIQLLSGLYITLAAITFLPDNDVVNRLILALLQRNCAAVVDWKSVEALRNVVLASA